MKWARLSTGRWTTCIRFQPKSKMWASRSISIALLPVLLELDKQTCIDINIDKYNVRNHSFTTSGVGYNLTDDKLFWLIWAIHQVGIGYKCRREMKKKFEFPHAIPNLTRKLIFGDSVLLFKWITIRQMIDNVNDMREVWLWYKYILFIVV